MRFLTPPNSFYLFLCMHGALHNRNSEVLWTGRKSSPKKRPPKQSRKKSKFRDAHVKLREVRVKLA